MDKNKKVRDHLCRIFDNLYDHNKEKIVRLAEELLNAQKVMIDKNILLTEETDNTKVRLKK